jgi:hypothetical protein
VINAALGFIELGAIVLAWTIVWNFAIKAFAALHPDNPAATGLVAVYSA